MREIHKLVEIYYSVGCSGEGPLKVFHIQNRHYRKSKSTGLGLKIKCGSLLVTTIMSIVDTAFDPFKAVTIIHSKRGLPQSTCETSESPSSASAQKFAPSDRQ
jgi:hypothetical protein